MTESFTGSEGLKIGGLSVAQDGFESWIHTKVRTKVMPLGTEVEFAAPLPCRQTERLFERHRKLCKNYVFFRCNYFRRLGMALNMINLPMNRVGLSCAVQTALNYYNFSLTNKQRTMMENDSMKAATELLRDKDNHQWDDQL